MTEKAEHSQTSLSLKQPSTHASSNSQSSCLSYSNDAIIGAYPMLLKNQPCPHPYPSVLGVEAIPSHSRALCLWRSVYTVEMFGCLRKEVISLNERASPAWCVNRQCQEGTAGKPDLGTPGGCQPWHTDAFVPRLSESDSLCGARSQALHPLIRNCVVQFHSTE